MENRVQLQPAYVLHRQAFQNTSMLVDFFCLDYGRVRAVAKGARREKSKYRSSLQPFQPLLLSFSGRGDLKTVIDSEPSVAALNLQGQRLFSGMYINELLTRLLHNYVEHKPLYLAYQDSLLALQGDEGLEVLLRKFELGLLVELGYGVNFESDCETDLPLEQGKTYSFSPSRGFSLIENSANDLPESAKFHGADLLRLGDLDFSQGSVLIAAKRLLRIALAVHLGDKPLHSRSLFRQRT
ncbi:MAG: DNA repair protein RecO (recombination protein O) [Pseudohongiellaceae bacterium]|jgi:DNA repair protein RecO (recombination protein O)